MTSGWRGFIVDNYFITLDTPGAVTDTGDDPRGADSPAEFDRQHAKIVAVITALGADVVGLMDIENDADETAVDTLVAGLNAGAPSYQQYQAIDEPDTGGGLFGSDAITVAMIYRPAAVTPLGGVRTSTDPAFTNARLPLAPRFRSAVGGAPFTVVVNHFTPEGPRSSDHDPVVVDLRPR